MTLTLASRIRKGGGRWQVSCIGQMFPGGETVQDACMLLPHLLGANVNVIQYAPGDKSMHVPPYGGD